MAPWIPPTSIPISSMRTGPFPGLANTEKDTRLSQEALPTSLGLMDRHPPGGGGRWFHLSVWSSWPGAERDLEGALPSKIFQPGEKGGQRVGKTHHEKKHSPRRLWGNGQRAGN